MSNNVGKSRRSLLIAAQSGFCGICGIAFTTLEKVPERGRQAAITRDHVVPKARGGMQNHNLVAAHYRCNCLKGDREPTGCELIWLDVANTGMAKIMPPKKIHSTMKLALAECSVAL